MKRSIIKLNDNKNHLSLGNIINAIKKESKNKSAAIQTEIFIAIFDIEDISYSTVNNYCVGSRSIGDIYKQKYISLKNSYINNKNIFIPIINNLLTIMAGTITNIKTIDEINNFNSIKDICINLYNISKNDNDINNELLKKYNYLITNKKYYELFIEFLLFAILDKKQPQYEEEKIINIVENILENTQISINDLENYLKLELNEGINFSHSLRNLANEGNAYAYFRLATMEYKGEYIGYPRYNMAYYYFLKSAEQNHPSAYWMLGNMIINNKIANVKYSDAIKYFKKAISLGNIAAINSLGICYKEGYGVKKDINKALYYFKKAGKLNYAYANNNIGYYYESLHNYNKAKQYYQKSANLSESYACNKIGEYHRKNNDMINALKYYNLSIESSYKEQTPWAYYNLAKYFYLNGEATTCTKKNVDKAIKFFDESSLLIESLIELLYIYYNMSLFNDNYYEEVLYYKKKIETHPKYTDLIQKEISTILKENKKIKEIIIP